MTTLTRLPQGFNPAYATQPIAGGNPPPRPPMTGGVTPMPNMGPVPAMDPSLIQPMATTGGNAIPQALPMQGQIGMGPNINNMNMPMATPQMMQSQAATHGSTGGGGTEESGGWLNWLKNYGVDLAGTAGTIYGALENADDTRDMGGYIQDYLNQMGGDLNDGAQFQGYGVSSSLGNSTVGANGSVTLGVDQYGNAQNAADAAYGAATNFANQAAIPVGQRQDDIYQSIMATQNPELNRMQAEQQAAEYARGRGGIRGSQYGGTAEDAAMARARAGASNDAAFRAREMANSERGMLGQLAGQFGGYGNQSLQASYLPMQQQIALLGLGQQNADMAQTGQLTGLDYMAQLGLGGANANINAMHSANQLTGNLYNALLSNLGGVQGSDGSAGSGILGAIGGSLFGPDGLLELFGFGE